MKQTLLLLAILLLTPITINADDTRPQGTKMPWNKYVNPPKEKKGKPAFSPWEYMKKEDEFITKKAGLTMLEANQVCPLLHKMKDELRGIDHQQHKLMEQCNNEGLNDEGAKSILEKIKALNVKKQDIESKYHHDMLQVISSKKLLKLLFADMKFDRFMLREMFMNKQNKKKEEKPQEAQK